MQRRLLFIFLFITQCIYSQQVATGNSHNLVIKNDGTLWAWGNNSNGQLGDGTIINKNTPAQIGTESDWKLVDAGDNFTMAIKNDGTLWAWGDNSKGQLGNGTTSNKNIPIQIGTSSDWKLVAAGNNYTMAIKNNGTLWAWGSNYYGQLGNGTTINKSTPIQIGTDSNWKVVVASFNNTKAIKNNGTLWAWGENSKGQLGDGTRSTKYLPTQIGTNTDWKLVESGGAHSIAIKNNGTLWAWGYSQFGQLGDGTINTIRSIPIQIGTSTNWKLVVASNGYNMAIKNDGTLWAWGENFTGQLGDGSAVFKWIPIQIGNDSDWKVVVVGDDHTIAVKNDDTFWTWGNNIYGQLGNGSFSNSNPTQIGTSTNWKLVESGRAHSTAIKNDGTLWTWGNNYDGQLGLGGFTYNKNSPTQVGTASDWLYGDAGDFHTMAIKNDGALWAWGDNYNGQLGDGTVSIRKTPIKIGAATDWQLVAAGSDYTLAIKKDGTLWGWGNNFYGQLGDGTTNNKNTPTQIGTASNWKLVAAGVNYTMAIKKDGTLWGWGDNFYGQLGDGTTSNKNIPTQIGTSTDWELVNVGSRFTMAIKNNGSLWGWGQNFKGQLGDGTTSNKNIPTQIGTSTDWELVHVSNSNSQYNHTVAIKKNGTLWAWGDNSSGQFGDGSNISKYTPTQIGIASDWKVIATAISHTIAIKNGGSLWAWGDNYNGQLGNGETFVPKKIFFNLCSSKPNAQSFQTFCSNGTIANLKATGTSIKWYAAATGGSTLAGTTALVNGTTYYASQTINSCESSDRLAVNVSITNTVAPTGNAIQTLITGSTLSDILVTGTAIKWYASATGGNPLTNTTPLVNGGIYYGSQTVNGCESQSRFMVTVTVTPFTLPFNNFTIETKSETCLNKNNGEIIINALQTHNYTAVVNGVNYNFVNNSLTLRNLPSGVYTVCIGITGKVFQQCYTVTIGKGGSITGKSSISSNKVIVDITSGTAPFEIILNGNSLFETNETNFTIDVKQGDLLEVKTAIACEGIYTKNIIDGLIGVVIHPNPTTGLFEITIPTSKNEVEVELYSIGSQLISKRKYPIVNQRVQLSLEKESDGVYFAKINLDSPISLTIIKKS